MVKETLPEISYIAIDTEASVISKGSVESALSGMHVRSMSGVVTDRHRYWTLGYSETLPSELTVSDIIDSAGEWTAFAEALSSGFRKFLFFGDQSGFAPIFYAFLPGSLFHIVRVRS